MYLTHPFWIFVKLYSNVKRVKVIEGSSMTVSTSGRDSAKKMECISKGIHTLNHFLIDLKPALNHLLHFE